MKKTLFVHDIEGTLIWEQWSATVLKAVYIYKHILGCVGLAQDTKHENIKISPYLFIFFQFQFPLLPRCK